MVIAVSEIEPTCKFWWIQTKLKSDVEQSYVNILKKTDLHDLLTIC